MKLINWKEKETKYLFLKQMRKTLIGLSLSLFVCLNFGGCLATPKVKEPPRVWWGKSGDTAEWDKAKVVADNYDWVVLDKNLYLQ